ncbi:MAG: cytohesin [Myxococcota bacterium]|jgi:cytohesin
MLTALVLLSAAAAATPAGHAAYRGDLTALAALPESDLDTPDEQGYTPLAHAALGGQVPTIAWLLERGARPDGTGGVSPLAIAANTCSPCVATLVKAGADVSVRDDVQRTPLHTAAQQGHVDAVDALLAGGADPAATDRLDGTPLLFAAHYREWAAVERLHAAGAALAVPTETALHHAARQGDAERVGWCLARGVPVNVAARQGTALHAAVESGSADAVRALLEAGATVDARRWDQWTPLHIAASTNDAASARLLLAAGAAVNARDRNNATPLHWATFGARPPEVHEWSADGGPHDTYWLDPPAPLVLTLLLAAGADPTLRNDEGRTPLAAAAAIGAATAVQVLSPAPVDNP